MSKKQRSVWRAIIAVLTVCAALLFAIWLVTVTAMLPAQAAQVPTEPTATPVLVDIPTTPPPGMVWRLAGDGGEWVDARPAPTAQPSFRFHGWTQEDAKMFARLAHKYCATNRESAQQLMTVAINRNADWQPGTGTRIMGSPEDGDYEPWQLEAAEGWLNGDWVLYGSISHFSETKPLKFW
ncbi:MAG: hypothetical protein FWF47_06770 [Clostridia bacterium]|nr:hypothetical protein [Clostridia bacterium]